MDKHWIEIMGLPVDLRNEVLFAYVHSTWDGYAKATAKSGKAADNGR